MSRPQRREWAPSDARHGSRGTVCQAEWDVASTIGPQGRHAGIRLARANKQGTDGMGRGIPVEINDILERYRESAVPDRPTGAAEAEALAELDAVAIKIDPEQDHELETLLEAARAQVRARAI